MSVPVTNRFAAQLASALLLALTSCAAPRTAPEATTPAPRRPVAARAEAAPVAPPTAPAPVAQLHHGIDVSGHSGAVAWPTVLEAGHSFAFVKATEGVDLVDPAFGEHWQAMKAAGVARGAYHFFVTEDDPEEQARLFNETVTLEPGDLAPVVDVELMGHGTPPGLPARLATWLRLVEAHHGVRPIIYTTAAFWDAHLTAEFGDYPLWVAEYQVEAPRLPQGWTSWHLWQWQGDAAVPGVEKTADLSRVNLVGVDLGRLFLRK